MVSNGVAENVNLYPSAYEPDFLTVKVKQYLQANNNSLNQCAFSQVSHENVLNFSESDYLGLAYHPTIIDSCIRALMESQSTHFDSGDCFQEALEKRFSNFLSVESTAFIQSAWSSNSTLLRTIAANKVPIYIDDVASLSIQEPASYHASKCCRYKRNDVDALITLIKRQGAGIIVVDAVSSIDGSLSALAELANVSEMYNCLFVVDESHSLGVYNGGKGLVSDLGLGNKVHFITANLSNSFACPNGLILGSERNIAYIRYHTKELQFAPKMLSEDIAKFNATLGVIENEDWRRVKLNSNAHYLRTRLYHAGFNVSMESTHIVNIISSRHERIASLYQFLVSHGVRAEFRTSPVTPKHISLIRFVVNAKHNKQQLDELMKLLELYYEISV